MKKRIFKISILVLVLVLALFVFTACNNSDTEVGVELLKNGDFENFDEDAKTFEGWTPEKSWPSSSEYGRQPVTNREPDWNDDDYAEKLGEQYLYLSNSSAAYSYVSQSVKVDRNKVYVVKVDVRVDADIKSGSNSSFKGAYVSFLENPEYYFKEQVKKNGWTTMTFYVKPSNTDYLTISLTLGAENAKSQGKVYFDNVSMQRIEAADVPSDETITTFKKAKNVQYAADVNGILFVVFLSLFSVAAVFCAYVIIRRLYASPAAFLNFDYSSGAPSGKTGKKAGAKGAQRSAPANKEWYKNTWFIAAMLALGTFLIRLIFLLAMYGFGSEMNFTANLAHLMGQGGGVRTAYAKYASLSSTAPGTLYILSIIGAMGKNLDYAGLSVLIRFVNVIADIAVVEMIYFYGRKYVGNRLSTVYAGLYAVLPIIFVMSGLNGTFASVLVALMLAAFILAVEKQYLATYLVSVLAIVLDIRMMAVVPIILAYFVYQYIRDDDNKAKFTSNRAQIIFGFIAAFALLYLLTLPVAIDQISAGQPFYNFTILANQVTTTTFFVKNALNLYGMVAMNGKTTSGTVNILNLIFLLVLEAYVISLYFKNRNKQEILLLGSFILAVIAVFTLKVDYTYLFLSLALGFIYTMVSGDKRMYGILGGYSLLGFLGVGQMMSNSGFVASDCNGYIVNFETTSPDFIIFCVLAVLLTGYYVYVTYSITTNGKIVDIKAMPEKFKVTAKNWFERVKDGAKIDTGAKKSKSND